MYIERDLLKMAIEAELFMTDSTKTVFRSIVRKVPTADVAPVVHGKWLLFGKRGIYGYMYACSECKAKYDGQSPYCPNCGAKMEGGKTDA